MRLFSKNTGKSIIISIIGPPNAGKTTLVRYLETKQPVLEDLSTTLGMELRSKTIEIDDWRIRIIDTGGQEVFSQTFWEIAIQQSNAVIFVIDATIKEQNNPELHELMFDQFDYALDIIAEDLPILILLNKQDLKEMDPMTSQDALKNIDSDNIKTRSIRFVPTSAKYGNGVEDAVKQLLDLVNN